MNKVEFLREYKMVASNDEDSEQAWAEEQARQEREQARQERERDFERMQSEIAELRRQLEGLQMVARPGATFAGSGQNLETLGAHSDLLSASPPLDDTLPIVDVLRCIVDVMNTATVGVRDLQGGSLPPRKNHLTGVRMGKLVGLSDAVERIKSIGTAPSRDQRPMLGMLNAPSGSGKSALLQHAEQCINGVRGYTALAVTFNHKSGGDAALDLTPKQGLTLRVAHRFLGTGIFADFRAAWLAEAKLLSLSLSHLLYAILLALPTKTKLLILVDEPGLAGDPQLRGRGRNRKLGTLPEVARALVAATQRARGAGLGGEAEQAVSQHVNFVFSSLTPVFSEGELESQTKTGSPLTWIPVPQAGDLEESSLKELVAAQLPQLRARMAQAHFDHAISLLVALASGHWSTLDALVHQARPPQVERGWLKTVYLVNVRDALVVSSIGVAQNSKQLMTSFSQLLAYSVFGQRVSPETCVCGYTVVQLAYNRVILNSITAEGGAFEQLVPRLSLLDVRRWSLAAHKTGADKVLAASLLDLLQSAGNDPTDAEAANKDYSLAFEDTMAHFMVCKALLFSRFGKGLLTLTGSNPLFPGHSVVHGKERSITAPQSTDNPRVIKIGGTGTFSKHDTFGEDLTPWSVVLPGSKRQPFADLLLIVNFHSTDRKGLVFIQCKYSDRQSTTKLTAATVNKALDKLLCKRNILFVAQDQGRRRGKHSGRKGKELAATGQIAALQVLEQDVVLCFSVLRDLEPQQTPFAAHVSAHARARSFRGTIIVANGRRGGVELFGGTFSRLALVQAA